MDAFRDLEGVHDHLIDNLNLEILELGPSKLDVGISGRVTGNKSPRSVCYINFHAHIKYQL